MSSWTEPVDLRVVDPRTAENRARNEDGARRVITEQLGAESTDILAMLALGSAA
ncbi:hypothetical protein [Curtobacterium sp. DN_7.5]|uniref:hypothetical protein n=1 Tax=Curtobacterium sp. DN_7.5 TaxID=3049047 RepID=UPI001F5A54A7|nr:hypothetical protein [Curtobacterium sp. DN_7.5]